MSYVIRNTELDIDYRKSHIQNLLDLHVSNKDISKSEVVDWAYRALKSGGWFYGIEKLPPEEWEDAIQARQRTIIALYNHMKTHGYTGSTISVYFDKKTGQVHTYDGYHRLSIMDYLGIVCDVNCAISYHHPTDRNQRGDFPLRQRIIEINGGARLYQPLTDKRVKDFQLWRPDSQMRLAAILPYLVHGSVLDCGCETGWFCRELSRRGYTVTGIDNDTRRVAITRYLKTIQNTPMNVSEGDWATTKDVFDNVLLLSVLHHDVLAYGFEGTKERLKALRGRCKRLVIEFPLSSEQVKWLPLHKKFLWNFTVDQFVKIVEDATGLKLVDVVYAFLKDRPIMVFGKNE